VPLAEPVEEAPELTELIFTGDVVFAGSIGRTDLPGGDDAAMRATLRDVVVPLPDTAALLPGHGPTTTMGHERITNRYLDEGYLS
jgi:hydroxyacylglutathione hydrolase